MEATKPNPRATLLGDLAAPRRGGEGQSSTRGDVGQGAQSPSGTPGFVAAELDRRSDDRTATENRSSSDHASCPHGRQRKVDSIFEHHMSHELMRSAEQLMSAPSDFGCRSRAFQPRQHVAPGVRTNCMDRRNVLREES